MELVIAAFVGLLLGAVGFFVVKKIQDQNNKKTAKADAERILQKAKAEAAKLKRDSENSAKDFENRARRNAEQDIQKQKNQLKQKESQLERKLKDLEDQHKQKIEDLSKQQNQMRQREDRLRNSENRIRELEHKAESISEDLRRKLEQVGQMSAEDAKRELFAALEEEAKKQAVKRVQQIQDEAEKEADKNAKKILSVALSRFASEYTTERTVSVLALPSDEMKGKIIGREGRNIRTLEAHCGVDLIVDDTPEAVVISGFDPVRRELAKRTLEKLMEDGRVHPARIEEVAEKQKQDLLKSMKEDGDKVLLELGLSQMHPELLKLLGSLKFRMSHAQNVLNHSMEVAYLSGIMASEMGINVKVAQRAGLLHDIGKAVDHTAEGSHSFVGAEWAKKYGESDEIVHAIRAHHEEEKPHSAVAWIVMAANILSNSRPGARRPQMDSFIRRLEDIESVGNSFDGVVKTYALQAGRDVRVFVESNKVTDDQAVMLSRDIVRKIEREMPQLQQLKLTVVRESRSVEHAR
jgi:ribonuclease Y